MAYVRKTMTMLDDVRSHVRRMKDRELNLIAPNNITSENGEVYKEMVKTVERKAWEKNIELMDKMPEEWCTYTRNATIKVRRKDGSGFFNSVSIEAQGEDKIKLPPKESSWRYACEVDESQLSSVLDKWYQDASNRDAKRQEITSKYDTIEDQLYKFLDSHASLNAALKEMPQLEMYIPEEYMTKYRQESAPRQKAERVNMTEELNIDTDALAAAAIAHRIATASGGDGA